MISLLIFVTSFLLIVWYRKYKRLPPGPVGLPIVGYYPLLGKHPLVKIHELSENYGHIMRLNLLGEDFYFLNSFEAVKEALKYQSETFSGRASGEFNLMNETHGTLGIVNAEGDDWKIQQKFYIGKLSGLGMGKTDFAFTIHELCDDLIDYIKENEEVTQLSSYVSNFTSNVVSKLVINKKYSLSDPIYSNFTETLLKMNSCGTDLNFYLAGPLAHLFFRVQRNLWNTYFKSLSQIREIMFARIKDRITERDTTEFNDLLDYCIQQMDGLNAYLFDCWLNKIVEKTNESFLLGNNLNSNFLLLFLAGTDTTSSTLNFGINLMATHQTVQQKVYDEIVEYFGNDLHLMPPDIEKLNYTRAVIDEIQRFACILPLGLIHCNIKPVNICGYDFPKRTKVVPNILKLSRDKRFFKNPSEFDPSNFLDENGKYMPNEALIPFGIGKRKCLGKKLAEMEIFIGLTRLVQEFEWLPPKNEDVKFEIVETLVRTLKPFKVIAIPRVTQQ